MWRFDKGHYPYLGEILRRQRLKKKMSLQEVADQIGGTKSKQSLMRYEQGKSKIDDATLEAMCRVLGLDPKEAETEAMKNWILDKHFSYTSAKSIEEEEMLSEFYLLSDFHQQQVRDMIRFLLDQEKKDS